MLLRMWKPPSAAKICQTVKKQMVQISQDAKKQICNSLLEKITIHNGIDKIFCANYNKVRNRVQLPEDRVRRRAIRRFKGVDEIE